METLALVSAGIPFIVSRTPRLRNTFKSHETEYRSEKKNSPLVSMSVKFHFRCQFQLIGMKIMRWKMETMALVSAGIPFVVSRPRCAPSCQRSSCPGRQSSPGRETGKEQHKCSWQPVRGFYWPTVYTSSHSKPDSKKWIKKPIPVHNSIYKLT